MPGKIRKAFFTSNRAHPTCREEGFSREGVLDGNVKNQDQSQTQPVDRHGLTNEGQRGGSVIE